MPKGEWVEERVPDTAQLPVKDTRDRKPERAAA